MQNMHKATHDGPSADPQVQGKRGYAHVGAEGCRLDPYILITNATTKHTLRRQTINQCPWASQDRSLGQHPVPC